jgi:hypothetical protein
MARLPMILVWLVTALVVLVMSPIRMGLLVIGHEKLPFLVLVVQFNTGKRAARKQAESAPHGSSDFNASFLPRCCCA